MASGDDIVKSVGRVFEVLELFDREKVALNGTEVERNLGYPQSSTLALLKSMVKLGYLSFDRIERTYFPTMRVSKMGAWIEETAYGEGGLDVIVKEVIELTGETVSLSCQNDLNMQFLEVNAGANPLTLNIQPGEQFPIFRSTVGLALLAVKPDAEIGKLCVRANRKLGADDTPINVNTVMGRVKDVRAKGYAFDPHSFIPTIGAMAWLLPSRGGARPLVLSVAGPTESIRSKSGSIITAVGAALAAHL